MWNNTTNTESICALNQIVCRNYLSACFPTALEVFMFQFQVELKFLSASSMGCCCSILNPFFPRDVPTTGFCAWNQLSSSTEQPSVACSSLPPLLSRKHHCPVSVPLLSASVCNSSFQFWAAPGSDFARRHQTRLYCKLGWSRIWCAAAAPHFASTNLRKEAGGGTADSTFGDLSRI